MIGIKTRGLLELLIDAILPGLSPLNVAVHKQPERFGAQQFELADEAPCQIDNCATHTLIVVMDIAPKPGDLRHG